MIKFYFYSFTILNIFFFFFCYIDKIQILFNNLILKTFMSEEITP